MKKLLVGLSFASFLIPVFASASTNFCPTLTDNLYVGTCDTSVSDDLVDLCQRKVSGTQVVDLQHFLTDYYHPATNIMLGYFGNRTKSLVMRFQGEQSLPQSGQVRALTRAAIARVCGGSTTPPPPPPPSNPTCTLSTNPSSVAQGQSSTLTWTSTNSTGGSIIPGIGPVSANGSQSISALQTTTFNGTFWNAANVVAHCSAILNVGTGNKNSASMNAAPASGAAPLTVTFTGDAGTGCNGGNFIIKYGDGGYDTIAIPADLCNAGFTKTHTYASAGTFTAVLSSAWTQNETLASATVTITTVGGNTSATLSASPSSGTAPLSVSFTGDTASGCNGGNFTLDYGDGTTDTIAIPADLCSGMFSKSHSYAAAGSYIAKILGKTAQSPLASASVTVTAPWAGNSGTGSISATPSSGPAPLTVQWNLAGVDRTVVNTATAMVDFGDGTKFVPPSTCSGNICNSGGSYTFQNAGTYTLKYVSSNGTIYTTATVTVTGGGTTGDNPCPDCYILPQDEAYQNLSDTFHTMVIVVDPSHRIITTPSDTHIADYKMDLGNGDIRDLAPYTYSGTYWGPFVINGVRFGLHYNYSSVATRTIRLIRKSDGYVVATVQYTNAGSGGVAQPEVSITSPLGNIDASKGSTIHFAWTSANTPAGAHAQLFEQSVAGPTPGPISSVENPTDSYDWHVPTDTNIFPVASSWKFYVRLVDSAGNPIATSQFVPVKITAATTASSAQDSQLASALAALQSALEAIQKLLGQ